MAGKTKYFGKVKQFGAILAGIGAALTNTIYIDPDGAPTGTGSDDDPVDTFTAAFALIGNAADATEFANPIKRAYHLIPSPATYTQAAFAWPLRPYIKTEMDGVKLPGAHSWDFSGKTLMTGVGAITGCQLIFAGSGGRAYWEGSTGQLDHGLVGDLTCTYEGSGFPQLHFDHCGMTGDISINGTASGPQIFLENTLIDGIIIGNKRVGIWATQNNINEDIGDTLGIGGVSGLAEYLLLDNVVISKNSDISLLLNSKWFDTRFQPGVSLTFHTLNSTLELDNATYENMLQLGTIMPDNNIKMADIETGHKYALEAGEILRIPKGNQFETAGFDVGEGRLEVGEGRMVIF